MNDFSFICDAKRCSHSFDLCTQTWSVITPSADSQIPSGRLFHAATVVGDGM